VALRLRNRSELDGRVQRHEGMAAADLAARHWPSSGAYQSVRAWLTSQGLVVDRDTDDRLMIEVHGTAAQVSQALGVHFSRVASAGQEFVATADAPALPAGIAPYVRSINGLQPYQHMHPLGLSAHGMSVGGPSAAAASRAAAGSVTFSGEYYPDGILRAYQALPYFSQTGAGTRTAILIDTLPKTSDLVAFWQQAGIAQSLSNVEFVQVSSGRLPAPSGEETLDAEWASGIGSGSKVRVYAAGSLSYSALDTALHRLLSDLSHGVAIQQLSISLGACETSVSNGQIETDNALLESITAQGVSIFAASGDDGAQECGPRAGLHPAFYATSPYVTAVGGTRLVTTAASSSAPQVAIQAETAWSGSGGGISSVFARPSYQSALPYGGRAVPDVAAVADPNTGVEIVLDGRTEEVGGTSVATPVWAGLMSLVNQARLGSELPVLGELNGRLYPLRGTGGFRDITSGSNGGYSAGPGYDLVTGLGSPILNALLPALVSQP